MFSDPLAVSASYVTPLYYAGVLIMNCGSCTECCKAIHIERFPNAHLGTGPDWDFIKSNWKKISARRAKKANPYIFSHGPDRTKKVKRSKQFYRCVNLTPTGCGTYETRPPVCRDYPYYGQQPHPNMAKDYSDSCVYIIEVS